MIFKARSIMLIFLLHLLLNQDLSSGIGWSQHLANFITKHAKVHQVIILKDQNKINGSFTVNNALLNIASRFPTTMIKISPEADEQFSKLIINDPQEALFVLIADDEDFPSLKKAFSLVSNLKPNRSRPKILIIFTKKITLQKSNSLLRQMWSHDFLDATIVSIYPRKGVMNHEIAKSLQKIILFYYNPHTNSSRSKKFSPEVQWFPDKTKNLHGHNLTVSITAFEPEIFVTTDKTGRREYSGLAWEKLTTLSDLMNFRLIADYVENWGYLNCVDKYKSTGAYYNMISKQSHFIAMEFQKLSKCENNNFEWSSGIIKSELCLVVPMFAKQFYTLGDSWKIFNLFGLMTLPIILWVCMRIAKINTDDLKLTYMIQIMLGTSAPREPRKLQEKMVFLFILVTCTLYSSVIYTTFTDMGLEKRTTYSLQSIDDVLQSDLDIEINVNYYRLLQIFGSTKVQTLIDKANKVERLSAACLQQLVTEGNIICIAFSMNAKFLLRNANDKCHLPKVKLLENDYLSHSLSQTVLAPRSPYVKRINFVLQKMIQCGITEKWKSPYEKRMVKNTVTSAQCFNKSEESQRILKQMFMILIFGYVFSTVIFAAEIFVYKIGRSS